jgi:hypothetical protein
VRWVNNEGLMDCRGKENRMHAVKVKVFVVVVVVCCVRCVDAIFFCWRWCQKGRSFNKKIRGFNFEMQNANIFKSF